VQTVKRCKPSFLDPGDVGDGEVFKIVAVEIVPREDTKFQRSDRTVLTVNRKGILFRWGINNTTHDRCVDTFTTDTEGWISQQIQVDKQLQIVAGKECTVLYGIPLVQEKIMPAEKTLPTSMTS